MHAEGRAERALAGLCAATLLGCDGTADQQPVVSAQMGGDRFLPAPYPARRQPQSWEARKGALLSPAGAG